MNQAQYCAMRNSKDSSQHTPDKVLPDEVWSQEVCLSLIQSLWTLRQTMLDLEPVFATELQEVQPGYQQSARNLIHYLAMRSVDMRDLQNKLAWLGLSSLGRSESHVLANLDKVLGILHRLTGQPWHDRSPEEPIGSVSGRQLLQRHSAALLGAPNAGRPVRIMVTLPSEAAHDAEVVRNLVKAGMDIARINCAHDDAKAWLAMATHVKRAAKSAQREIRILMDLGGPKIRTGEVQPRPAVLRLRPHRDDFGRVYHPARLGLFSGELPGAVDDVDACIAVDPEWLNRLKVGSQIDYADARGARRHLMVVSRDDALVIAESIQTAYLTPDTALTVTSSGGKKKFQTIVGAMDDAPGVVQLHRGEILRLTKDGLGHSAVREDGAEDEILETARIACTLPQIFSQVHIGERIWFDDGRIGGVIRHVSEKWLEVEITQARPGGERLVADKGINLPDSQLDLPALTEKDLEDLATVASCADMVGLSFVQKPADIHALREHLKRLDREDMGIILKIETLQGFENLPELMLAAMAASSAGVMIARGDLAVECGYERLAEVQEEILWCAEAAHLPVIWATQVLETLAKTGVPSRAEISDAGLGVRAECVMLNKGPYITDAIRSLDDILQRMGGHQAKKRPLLRALRAWGGAPTTAADKRSAAARHPKKS